MLKNQKDFNPFFDALCAKKHPFVMFRLPQSKEIVLYAQQDNKHHQTTSLKEKGFVFAPFSTVDAYTYIPNEIVTTFSTPILDDDGVDAIKPSTSHNKAYYLNLISAAKQAIYKEDLKKVVVSRTQELNLSGATGSSFLRLIHAYPNAMVYYWSHPQTGAWMGASPETLLNIKANKLKTMALAGTLPFSEKNNPSWTTKEVEEQQMVTDYIQLQLQTLFPKSSIKISSAYTKRAGNLVHLCADFEVPVDVANTKDIVQLLHPTPAVAGVPVENSLQFLAKHETHNRDFYSGFFGPIMENNINLFVNIRCAQVAKKLLTLYVGGGITAESNAEKEWQESQRKAETLLNVL